MLVHSSAGHYGADRQLALLCRTLDRTLVEPTVLLPHDGPLTADLDVPVRFGRVPVLRRETLTPGGLARLARDARAAGAWVRAEGFDVVHANTSVVLGMRAAPRLTVHVREIYPPVPVAWPAHRRSLARADALVCVSAATRAALGVPGAHVVHDGLDPAVVDRPAPGRAAARATLGVPQDAVVAAVLGRLSPWKGQALLLEAAADVAGLHVLMAGDAWPGAEGTAAGPSPYEIELRRLAAAVPGGVTATGFRPDVEAVLAAADVVVVPSTAPDPLPNSALEAAAAGRPVVAADHGGLPEIVRDGETGRLFTPGDAHALSAALRDLVGDPAQRERLGAAAARDVRARFPADGPARALERLWV